MPLVEDLSVFFADMGEDATLAGAAVRVIFDAPGGQFGGISATQPQVTIATASVPASYLDAALVIPGRGSFSVTEHVPDGTGVSVLLLQAAA